MDAVIFKDFYLNKYTDIWINELSDQPAANRLHVWEVLQMFYGYLVSFLVYSYLQFLNSTN